MCHFASFVLTKDREFWLDTSDSHENIITHYKLHADGASGPNILRIELTPPSAGDWGILGNWVFRIDQDITPDWASGVDAMQSIEARTRLSANVRFSKEYKVGGGLSLGGCTGLKALPENLKVGGYLYLNGCTGLKALPESLKVGGGLYLGGCTATVPASLRKKVVR